MVWYMLLLKANSIHMTYYFSIVRHIAMNFKGGSPSSGGYKKLWCIFAVKPRTPLAWEVWGYVSTERKFNFARPRSAFYVISENIFCGIPGSTTRYVKTRQYVI